MPAVNRKYRGFLITEIIVALTLLGLILAALAMSLNGFARFNRYQLVTQRCIAAAQAQLDSITATGKTIPEDDLHRLWPELSISIEKSAGTGQWRALILTEVTASGRSYNKEVKVRLSRYIPAETMPKITTNNPTE